MNGNRYLLDTNAVIALLQGDKKIIEILKPAVWIGISIITQLEFLVFPDLSSQDKELFEKFLQKVAVIGLAREEEDIIRYCVKYRQEYRIKLPDAIIAATSKQNEAVLVTADKQLHSIHNLPVLKIQHQSSAE